MVSSSASSARAGRDLRLRLWTLGWAMLAVFQVTQAIWLSGGAAAPGGMSDGRFSNYVIEHGWLALRGVYPLDEMAQLFPAKGTYSLSDTHVGTLPIYAALRALGLPMERAWQGWFVVLAALNAFAAWRVLRALDVPAAWRGPAVFAASAAPAMTWTVGNHMQMLPLAPTLFALDQLVRWSRDRASHRWPLAFAWLAWQLAAAPYTAFFAAVALGATGLAALVVQPWRSPEAGLAVDVPARRRAWWRAAPILVAGPALAAVVAHIYLNSAGRVFGKSTLELASLAPAPASWFSASPCNLLGAAPAAAAADAVEHAWFSGWLVWFALPVAAWFGWRTRRRGGAWAAVLALGVAVGAVYFTRWSDAWPGLWIWTAEQFAFVRGFRGVGRAALLFHPLQVFALVGALAVFVREKPGRARAMFAGVVLGGLVAESLAWRQPALRFADCAAREEPLIAAWRAAGDQPVLAYAPGYTNQPIEFIHTDAWGAALRLHRRTINGYSSTLPDSHVQFFRNPTLERAHEVCALAGVDRATVSFVTAVAPEAERAIDLVRYPGRPVTALEGFALQASAWRMDVAPVRFEMEGRVLHQFTPPSEAVFALPDDARTVEFLVAMRDGSWNGPGRTDGAEYRWAVRAATGEETELLRETLNPRDVPAHRGVLTRSLALPPGARRSLVLRTTSEPSGDNWWDWPLVGELRAR